MECSPWAPTQVIPSYLMTPLFSVHFTGILIINSETFVRNMEGEGTERAQEPKTGEEGDETLSSRHGVVVALMRSQQLWSPTCTTLGLSAVHHGQKRGSWCLAHAQGAEGCGMVWPLVS